MANIITHIKNFCIGRKYTEETLPEYFRLVIIDIPYYKHALILIYALIIASLPTALLNETVILRFAIFLLIFTIALIPLYRVLPPLKELRFAEIHEDGLFLSAGMTFYEYSGKILWSKIKNLTRTNVVENPEGGIIVAASLYRLMLKNGKTIEIYRIFSEAFEKRFIEIIEHKNIPIL